jgi:triphosphoribosyl-dephospho-CoA synthetase
VDLYSNGAHTDMDAATFRRSADALRPFFVKMAREGLSFDGSAQELFMGLRGVGMDAEQAMYEATHGVNTHKGAIFSLGILAGAVGRMIRDDGTLPSTDRILDEAASIARDAITQDLQGADASTAGGRAYLERGMRGIRGEVADGFPSLREIALPAYKTALAGGKAPNDAGVLTLLCLIANVYDTNLYKRGGDEGVRFAREYARALLATGDPSLSQICQMDVALTERNLSPGGCADLLALTYFLTELEGQKQIEMIEEILMITKS